MKANASTTSLELLVEEINTDVRTPFRPNWDTCDNNV